MRSHTQALVSRGPLAFCLWDIARGLHTGAEHNNCKQKVGKKQKNNKKHNRKI